MKISSTYNKSDIERQSRLLMALSVLAPTILLIVLTVLMIYFASYTLNSKINEQLDLVAESASEGLFLEREDDQIFSSCVIIYYNSEGYAINGVVGFSDTYYVGLNKTQTIISGTEYRVRTQLMQPNSNGAYYVAVYMDMTDERNMYRTIVWISIVVFVLCFAVLSIVTYILVKRLIKHYEKAIVRNNQLVSDISHEFNTPLAIIKASLAKVMAEPDKKVEDVSESLITVTHEAGRLNRMVRDMLILSRSDSERLIVEKKNCDISEIVHDVIEPFQMMCDLDGKIMDVKIADNIKSFTDEDKIRQSLIILLDNAVKYTKTGDSISVMLKDGFGRYFITVADTGIGVAKENLQNIFERFYRTDASRNSETGGSGLGLSIIKAIALCLKGKVSASQNKPKGFRVDLEFPKERLM